MNDIVERLRQRAHNGIAPMPEQARLDMLEAAAEIGRLRTAVKYLRLSDAELAAAYTESLGMTGKCGVTVSPG